MFSASQRCVLRLVLALLWLGAVHHCAFEGLVRGVARGTVNAAADYDGGGCSSHTAGDPISHKEGSPCVAPFTLNEVDVVLAAPPLTLFAALVRRFESLDPSVRPDSQSLEHVYIERGFQAAPVTTLSHSLSLAPNAPPRVA